MILLTARVENYKCIEDSTEFSLGEVTALVGKNESGKSALLEALYKLNPIIESEGNFDEIEEYPRRELTEYEQAVKKDPGKRANVLTTVWALTPADKALLRERFGDAIQVDAVTVSKGYSNEQRWSFAQDESRAVQSILDASDLSAPEREDLRAARTIADVIAALLAVTAPSNAQSSFLARVRDLFPEGSMSKAVASVLAPHLPKFVYFSEYHRLPGQVQLEGLQQRLGQGAAALTVADRMFLAFLQQTGTELTDLIGAGKFEHFVARLEAVSNRITREIVEYWSQNRHLLVEFRVDPARLKDPPPFNAGMIFRIRVKNTRHGVTVAFDERSAGFVWFFSFIVWFSQARRTYGERLVILLDEPGLSLHARAQSDLLRYIDEKLRPHFGVIYTTHSAFMIDPDNVRNARTVEDVVEGEPVGTKVGDTMLSTDRDTVFPLQAALGYDAIRSLFVGKSTLLVERPGDVLYLQAFSHALRAKGRIGLDRRWAIAPTGGVDKVVSFVALFAASELQIAVLASSQEGLARKGSDLRGSALFRKGYVFSADVYAGQNEADLEDIIGREVYTKLVNRCYNLSAVQRLPDARPAGAPSRVVQEVEAHFSALPRDVLEFDRYLPATFLVEHGPAVFVGLPGVQSALERFEKLFADINSLLEPAK